MASKKKNVYVKGQYGVSEFIYVDLLPEVKRMRQFNGQVIVILLLFVVLSFVLVFLPYNNLISEFEEKNGINQDLKHELQLTQEEFAGYEIDVSTINFAQDIDGLYEYALDYPGFLGDITLVTKQYNADLIDFSFSLAESGIAVTVSMATFYQFEELNSQLHNIPWVTSSEYTSPQRIGNEVVYHSTFTLGVDFNVE